MTTIELLQKMKDASVWMEITSDPDYEDEADVKKHSAEIDTGGDWEIKFTWGDSNCPYQKDYDPKDGHGFTPGRVIGTSFENAVEQVAKRLGFTQE